MNEPYAKTSRFLSYVLRHAPETIGLTLDREGWADMATLMEGAGKAGRDLDLMLIRAVVAGSDKKRFSISEDGLRIRAVQGHSTPTVALTFAERQPPTVLYHGTATRFVESILSEGLKARARQYVHLSEDMATAVAVGKRYGKLVVLKIDALRMHQQGFRFLLAENGVWLVESVPSRYVEKLSD
jgi:putative RNA 2'-phosphotransferase